VTESTCACVMIEGCRLVSTKAGKPFVLKNVESGRLKFEMSDEAFNSLLTLSTLVSSPKQQPKNAKTSGPVQ
jgi:hypothetical protein